VQARRGPLKMPTVADGEIVRLRLEGKLWREIAAEVGRSRNGVCSQWRRLKLSGKVWGQRRWCYRPLLARIGPG